MMERALLLVLVALMVTLGAAALGDALRDTFCAATAALVA